LQETNVMLFLQMLAGVGSVFALRAQGAIELAPLSVPHAKILAPVAFLYCSNAAFALASLGALSVPLYTTCVPPPEMMRPARVSSCLPLRLCDCSSAPARAYQRALSCQLCRPQAEAADARLRAACARRERAAPATRHRSLGARHAGRLRAGRRQ
jgi:hypothetical protein